MEKKIVFIVENDNEILDVLYLILSEHYEVHLFTAPPENFLAIINKKKPHLLILDWLIPNVHTEDLIYPIRTALEDNIKILIISAHNSVQQAFYDKPVDAILAKPFGSHQLKEIIQKLLSQGEIKEA